MKLFQQLLLAPAALGLLAPIAATAAEVNINDVAGYANKSTKQVRVNSVQFSDVVPGDWAYTALQNLSESYGCVDNAYTQNLKSGQALTRYEAASLLNACLNLPVMSRLLFIPATDCCEPIVYNKSEFCVNVKSTSCNSTNAFAGVPVDPTFNVPCAKVKGNEFSVASSEK